MNPPLLAVALACAIAVTVLGFYIAGHMRNPEDITVARDVQATNWGPVAYSFAFFSWIGDAKGAVLEIVIFVAVLIFNRRTWLIAAGGVGSGVWYAAVSHLLIRPRPAVPDVLRVTEHPGASSFPSGHTIFIVTVTVVLMLCFGYRFLPRAWRVAGWAAVVLIVFANAIARVYTGAHWPSDVLAGLLIGAGWMCLLMSSVWVSRRVLDQPTSALSSTPAMRAAARAAPPEATGS